MLYNSVLVPCMTNNMNIAGYEQFLFKFKFKFN